MRLYAVQAIAVGVLIVLTEKTAGADSLITIRREHL